MTLESNSLLPSVAAQTATSNVVAESNRIISQRRAMRFHPGWMVIPACVIAALCVTKSQFGISLRAANGVTAHAAGESRPTTRPAPLFEGQSANNQLVRLASLVGRHEVQIVFTNLFSPHASTTAATAAYAELSRYAESQVAARRKVVVVTSWLPQDVRLVADRLGRLPASIVSDPDGEIHRLYGQMAKMRSANVSTVVVTVDRRGNTTFKNDDPEFIRLPTGTAVD